MMLEKVLRFCCATEVSSATKKKATLAVIFDSSSDKLSPAEEGEKKKHHKMSELRFSECWRKVARKNDNTLNPTFLHLTAAGIITTVSDV